MPGLPVVGKAHEDARAGAPFTWFIYGSSLDLDAFTHWAGEHGYRVPDFARAQPARLDGHRLAFNVNSRFWGGATASLVAAPGESVEGIALPMTGEQRGLVDHKEGAISGLYAPFAVEVVPLAGGAPIAAVAYRAAKPVALPDGRELLPSPQFVDTLIRGARASGLSEAWIARLTALR
jgi:gamma-glutamylcyclotransferase